MSSVTQRQTIIGILGGGQLGLMLSEALCNLGAHVRILEPSTQSPSSARTPFVTQGKFDDEKVLRDFFSSCDRVTYEFEHIPTQVLRSIVADPVHRNKLWPSLTVLENSQNRISEKKALAAARAPIARWAEINTIDEFLRVKSEWLNEKRECLLKTATGGYDGKGQWTLRTESDWNTTFEFLNNHLSLFPFVIEEKCQLETELSVIVGRHPTLGTYLFPTVENIHINGILDTTFHPPRIDFELSAAAQNIATRIAESWDVFGLLCVEFFVVRKDNTLSLLVNEVAPRPHNSGHITRRSMTRSQFDILAQILLDLPLSSHPVAPELTWCMWNTLGDLWLNHDESRQMSWPAELISHNAVCETFLYGKTEPRVGRKMGHVILNAPSAKAAERTIAHLRSSFKTSRQGGHL